MGSIVQSLFAACIGGFIMWFFMRRAGESGATSSTTAEIDRLRTVVEELTAALERKAEAAEQRLAKLISEAQAVHSVLDRTLTAVGAQMVKTESAPSIEPAPPPRAPEPIPAPAGASIAEPVPAKPSIEIAPRAEPVRDLLAVEAPKPEPDTPSPFPTPAPATELAVAETPAPVEPPFKPEPIAPVAVPADTMPSTAVAPPVQQANAVEPVPAPAPKPKAPEPVSGGRDSKETAEREARVMSLVARGVTNSVDIARQTGLTRGEVELILTLHNLHMAPASMPIFESQAAALIAATSADTVPVEKAPVEKEAAAPVSPDDIVVNPDDRYAAIYQLVAAGVTDPIEIARRTGLGRGEVELHMGLHARNVL
jgi:hypothetical protein